MSLFDAIPWAIIVVGIGGVFWLVRKAGKDSAKLGATEDALTDINNALRPIDNDDVERVQRKYRRD